MTNLTIKTKSQSIEEISQKSTRQDQPIGRPTAALEKKKITPNDQKNHVQYEVLPYSVERCCNFHLAFGEEVVVRIFIVRLHRCFTNYRRRHVARAGLAGRLSNTPPHEQQKHRSMGAARTRVNYNPTAPSRGRRSARRTLAPENMT